VLGKLTDWLGSSISGYAPGCLDGPPCTQVDIASAVSVASKADLVIMVLGEKSTDNSNYGDTGREGNDRRNVTLPGLQSQLVQAILALDKPVVAIIISGGMLVVSHTLLTLSDRLFRVCKR
jgi:beta-glucosidase